MFRSSNVRNYNRPNNFDDIQENFNYNISDTE